MPHDVNHIGVLVDRLKFIKVYMVCGLWKWRKVFSNEFSCKALFYFTVLLRWIITLYIHPKQLILFLNKLEINQKHIQLDFTQIWLLIFMEMWIQAILYFVKFEHFGYLVGFRLMLSYVISLSGLYENLLGVYLWGEYLILIK
jgi:hypothetical protein